MKKLSLAEKEFLLKDLSARLPYGVICTDNRHGASKVTEVDIVSEVIYFVDVDEYVEIKNCKPYLRKLSSMTEEEKAELLSLVNEETKNVIEQLKTNNCGIEEGKYHFNHLLELDWLNKKMFAYRTIDGKDMFELGLALEAPEEMYK